MEFGLGALAVVVQKADDLTLLLGNEKFGVFGVGTAARALAQRRVGVRLLDHRGGKLGTDDLLVHGRKPTLPIAAIEGTSATTAVRTLGSGLDRLKSTLLFSWSVISGEKLPSSASVS
jgi:hypothetical protein